MVGAFSIRVHGWVISLFVLTVAAPAVAGEVHCGDDVRPREASRAKLRIASQLDDGPWVSGDAVYPKSGQRVSLRVKAASGAKVRWYLIFADLSENYKNANRPGEPGAYEWVGFGKIRYCRMELESARNRASFTPFKEKLWEQVAAGMPTFAKHFYHERLGTFWFQAEVTRDGKVLRSIRFVRCLDNTACRDCKPRACRPRRPGLPDKCVRRRTVLG